MSLEDLFEESVLRVNPILPKTTCDFLALLSNLREMAYMLLCVKLMAEIIQRNLFLGGFFGRDRRVEMRHTQILNFLPKNFPCI